MKTTEFFEYIRYDVLGGLTGITERRMFGGYGFYQDGVFFAIISNGELYLKVDETNRYEYESRGCHPFTYVNGKKGSTVTLSYWSVPEDFFEDSALVTRLVAQSVAITKK